MLRATAKHISPKYACTDAPVRIGYDSYRGTYYANMAGYGMGHPFATPEEAVRGLLEHHACYDIQITGKYIPDEWVQL